MSELELLCCDEWLIGLNKPSGLPTAPTRDPQRQTLYHLARRVVGRELWVSHRLDLGTSGVVVMAAHPDAVKPLALSFEQRRAHKLYWALTAQLPQGLSPEGAHRFKDARALLHWHRAISEQSLLPREMLNEDWLHVSAPLREGPREGGRSRWEVTRSGGKPSHTLLRVIAIAPGLHLIGARPLTGRTHQIRVHLAHLEAPLIGDPSYGGPKAPRLMLHARSLELPHPMSAEPLSLRARCDFTARIEAR